MFNDGSSICLFKVALLTKFRVISGGVMPLTVVSGCSDASVVALKRAVVSFTIVGLQRSASLMPGGHVTATGGLVHLRHDGIAYGLQLLLLMLVFILFSRVASHPELSVNPMAAICWSAESMCGSAGASVTARPSGRGGWSLEADSTSALRAASHSC